MQLFIRKDTALTRICSFSLFPEIYGCFREANAFYDFGLEGQIDNF